MAKPQWKTTAGSLATIDERVTYSKRLVADEPTGETVTFSKIAGDLPPGITLSNGGVLAGVPLEVDRRKQYKFVVRATTGTFSADRTFDIVVEGNDGPTWTTPAGNILTVNDGEYINYQLEATDLDDNIKGYRIKSGALPASLKLNTNTGKITGVVALLGDSTQVHTFTVEVNDGVKYVDREFSITFSNLGLPPRSDTTNVSADSITITTDKSNITDLYWLQPENSVIGRIRHQNYNVVMVDVFDPGDITNLSGETKLVYSISAGSLPTGMSISTTSGEIYGATPLLYDAVTTFTFTVQVEKKSPLFPTSSFYTRQFKIEVLGQGFNEITWGTFKEMEI